MRYIKPTHDVLGLERRVKAVIKTNAATNKIGAINSVYLTDGTDNWTLYRRPSKSSTQMWVTFKKGSNTTITDDTLNGKSPVAEDEVLARVTVSGKAPGMDTINVFNQGADAGCWGCYANGTLKIEARNASHIASVAMLLKPTNYTDTIQNVQVQLFRGVRRVIMQDVDVPENGILELNFPV